MNTAHDCISDVILWYRKGLNSQVLHKNVQTFATSGCAVDSLEHRRHIARLNRLKDLYNGLEVSFLTDGFKRRQPLIGSDPTCLVPMSIQLGADRG